MKEREPHEQFCLHGEITMKKRNPSLDVLKFCAMILIVLHHYQQIYAVSFKGINFYGGQFNLGWVVELFFELSGLVIVKYIPRIKKGLTLREFYLKRYLRIAPVMILSVLAFSIIYSWKSSLATGIWATEKITLWNILITCLGIQNGWVCTNPGINNPLWYISILLLCYVIFYILTALAARIHTSESYLYMFMILLGIAIQTCQWEAPFLMFNTSRGYTAFFCGILLGMAIERFRPGKRTAGISVLIAVCLTLLLVQGHMFMKDHINLWLTFLYYPAVILIFCGNTFSKLRGSRVAGILGRLSFDAYIWHNCCFDLINALNTAFRLEIDFGLYQVAFVCVLVTLVWSLLSYFILETPAEKMVNRFLARQFPADAE